MDSAILLENIRKTYRSPMLRIKRTAISDLSLEVRKNEIFGLLGPNGAGKTTTLKIILGLVSPDSGTGQVLGEPLGSKRARTRIGFLPEQPYFYGFMTAEKALMFYGHLAKLDTETIRNRNEELLNLVGLPQSSHLTLEKYSKGMLQRFGIAQALLNDPDLVIMDEPSSGLDPVGQKEIRDIIISLKELGKTVFLSSHQLSEVESVCDSVSIINRGSAVAQGKLDDLLEVKGVSLVTFTGESDRAREFLSPLARRVFTENGKIHVEVDSGNVYEIIMRGKELGLYLQTVSPFRKTLEDLFMEIVRGREI